MQLTEIEYQQLKAEFDAEAKTETERIELERVQNHLALDRLWTRVQRYAKLQAAPSEPVGSGVASLFTPTFVSDNDNGNGNGSREPRAPFPMKEAVRTIIKGLGQDAEITQPVVFKIIMKLHAEHVAHRNKQHVRGQITGILSKLAEGENPELVVVKEADGNEPKVFMLNHVEVG